VYLCALALAVALGGCSKKPKATLRPMPLPPVPSYRIPADPEPMPEPPVNTLAALEVAELPAPASLPPLEIPDRPAPTPRARPRAGAMPPESAAPPAPVPQLGQLLSEEEMRGYRAELDQAAKETSAILAAAARYPLTREQKSLADRARVLSRQAEAQRATDLVTARNLARRALILAQELQRTLR
jgi:hypothetical protein